ncbi:amino acid permease [Falsibacillus albus]|uniref:Amino acid permease n=1 Tax=Falsibacillus albus TaxID=2478915 RepID=A0A3L7JTA9_9BACI|nr:amino acid permease [Falsibacillus albus]RLQ94107.1 amino acid permease [Falsibacillus albus]
MVKHRIHKQQQPSSSGSLTWWQLSLLGVGCTTGTGFFLGISIAIEESGYTVILTLVLAALGTYFVFDALAKLIAQQPLDGSYRTYASQAFGHWAGFMIGWIYWSSEIMIVGSTLTALGLFAQYWFPHISLWLLIAIFGVLGLIVAGAGGKIFEKAESVFALIKIAAIVMFILLAILTFSGAIDVARPHYHIHPLFKDGVMGGWKSFIYAFYAFAGIEVIGLMATNLQNPKEAPKSGKLMITLLSVLYFGSVFLALLLVPLTSFTTDESPFITALKHFDFPIIVNLFNGVLIIAGFSTMVASLYCVTLMLMNLSKDGDAPKLFRPRSVGKLSFPALGMTTACLAASIIMALVLPKHMYEYVTTAGSLLLLYTWLFIIFTARKLLKLKWKDQFKTLAAIGLIVIAVSGSTIEKTSRTGFWVSLLFIIIISLVTIMARRSWKAPPASK